jgi:hypothetical protein
MARFGTLEDFLHRGKGTFRPGPGGKIVRGTPDGGTGGGGGPARSGDRGDWLGEYYHAHAIVQSPTGPVYGCQGWFNLWAPEPTPGVFSLGQLWILRQWWSGLQTIESGWQVYPERVQGARLPYLFVFTNPDNYKAGSGYVGDPPCGFIYYPSPGWVIGSPLDPDLVTQSEDPAAQHGIMMRWAAYDNGDWELWVGLDESDLQKVGYIPGAYYGPGQGGQPFEKLQFGGEVSSRSVATGAMGSLGGRQPSGSAGTDFGKVAFIRNVAAQYASGGTYQQVNDFQPYLPDESAGYRCTTDQTDEWGTYLFFGGPNG